MRFSTDSVRPGAEKILAILHDEMQKDVSAVDTDLFEQGVLDSLSFVDLLTRLEQAFGVQIEMEALELEDFRSVASIAQLLDKWTEAPALTPAAVVAAPIGSHA